MTGRIVKVSVAVGLAGLVWAVNEVVISRLEKRDLGYDIEVITTNDLHLLKRMQLEKERDKFEPLLNAAKKVRALNPLSYLIPYARRVYALRGYKAVHPY